MLVRFRSWEEISLKVHAVSSVDSVTKYCQKHELVMVSPRLPLFLVVMYEHP